MQKLTTAGQRLVTAMPSSSLTSPWRSKSMPSPFVSTLMPTLPTAYAVLPRKKRLYTGGLTTTMRPPAGLASRCGRAACTAPYRPSTLTRCISWKRLIGVSRTEAHHMAPGL